MLNKNFLRGLKPLLAICLIVVFLLVGAPSAHAKRGGGRVGGGSFSRSRPSLSRPSSGSRSYNPVYGNWGGGGFFFVPFFFGGGSLFSGLFGLLVLVVIASVILSAFRGSSGKGITGDNTRVTIAKIQVGLLAGAKQIQQDLTRLAMEADTTSNRDLLMVLRETVLSLLRHPEYWVYVSSAKEVTTFALAEQKYESLVMSERLKLSDEVVSNQRGRRSQKTDRYLPSPHSELEDPSEYIVVTILAAITGDSLANLPPIRSSADLKQALAKLGGTAEDQLIAVEVLWEPQGETYTLSADEMLAYYPDLVRI
jgi:uncharacterized membrane protein